MRSLKRKTKKGIVVSDKMQKTVVVEVSRSFPHPFYEKIVHAIKKLKAHDEKNECAIGDVVEIMECRPISRDKKWRVVKILGKAKVRTVEFPIGDEKKEKVSGEGEVS